MKYILKHKEYKTYYCFDKELGRRFLVDGSKAYKFRLESSAAKMRSKFKYPDKWEIIEVKNGNN